MPEESPFPLPGQPKQSTAQSSGANWLILALLIVIAALLYRYRVAITGDILPAEARPITPRGELGPQEQSQIELFKVTSPSVVHITTNRLGRRDPRSLELDEIPAGNGTGFIWDEDGHIVTNYHVIRGADSATVVLNDYTAVRANLVGFAPDKDLAVLRITVPAGWQLRPIPLASSDEVQVGQFVAAIGSPFGLEQTFTTGIVSALGRSIQAVTRRSINDVIQTDAAINPGNSGGPLLDSAGRLIGVNTAIAGGESGTSSGVGFAIPVDIVNRYVPQLIRTGAIEKPGLGVVLMPDGIVAELLRAGRIESPGALVRDVPPDSSAAKAGIRGLTFEGEETVLGDLIVAVDGEPIRSNSDLSDLIQEQEVNQTVTVTILRDGQRQEVPVKLQDLSAL